VRVGDTIVHKELGRGVIGKLMVLDDFVWASLDFGDGYGPVGSYFLTPSHFKVVRRPR
jgi:hypothetical protein